MAKLLKKDLIAAVQPLRRSAERLALAEMNGAKRNSDDLAIYQAGVDFHGYNVKVSIIRKARISPGIPAPYSMCQLRYSITHPIHGQMVAGWDAPSLPGQFFIALHRRGLQH
jgi:hypothetical protein